MSIRAAILIVAVASLGAVHADARQQAPPRRDVIYVPTPPEVVEGMLKAAKVTTNDVVYDLGSGDGRIVIMAAKVFGARGVGIDIDPERTAEANANAKEAGVSDRVRFMTADLFTADIGEATVVTLYLLGTLNQKLLPKLNRELKPGTRVVSHAFDMGETITPRQTLTIDGRSVFLFVTPIR